MWSSVKLIALLAVSLRACKLEQVKIKLLYLLIKVLAIVRLLAWMGPGKVRLPAQKTFTNRYFLKNV